MPFLSIIGALFSGLLKKILAVTAAIPPKVWYCIAAVALLLLLWHLHGVKERAALADARAGGVASEKIHTDQVLAANVIQAASIAELERDLAAKNAESDARAKALADSKAASDADQARFAALRKADAGKDETLRGIRDGALAKPTCKVPDALTAQLGGL